jgi:ribosomal protein S21
LIELRSRETYTKPSVAKKIAREVAKKRWKKHLASQNLPKVSR